MKLSQAIATLQEYYDKWGDIEVMTENLENDNMIDVAFSCYTNQKKEVTMICIDPCFDSDWNDCVSCEAEFEDESPAICRYCGETVCSYCIHGPDPKVFGEEAGQEDYCPTCYRNSKYIDQWLVSYSTTQGDYQEAPIFVERGTHSFKIKSMAPWLIGGMYKTYIKARKITKEE